MICIDSNNRVIGDLPFNYTAGQQYAHIDVVEDPMPAASGYYDPHWPLNIKRIVLKVSEQRVSCEIDEMDLQLRQRSFGTSHAPTGELIAFAAEQVRHMVPEGVNPVPAIHRLDPASFRHGYRVDFGWLALVVADDLSETVFDLPQFTPR